MAVEVVLALPWGPAAAAEMMPRPVYRRADLAFRLVRLLACTHTHSLSLTHSGATRGPSKQAHAGAQGCAPERGRYSVIHATSSTARLCCFVRVLCWRLPSIPSIHITFVQASYRIGVCPSWPASIHRLGAEIGTVPCPPRPTRPLSIHVTRTRLGSRHQQPRLSSTRSNVSTHFFSCHAPSHSSAL